MTSDEQGADDAFPGAPRRLQPLCERIGRRRVEKVVHSLYTRLRSDAKLGPFFRAIPDFAAHEARIADFWWIAMGGRVTAPPVIDMLGRHRPLGLVADDFSRWLKLLDAALAEQLPADLAAEWGRMAAAIAARLQAALMVDA